MGAKTGKHQNPSSSHSNSNPRNLVTKFTIESEASNPSGDVYNHQVQRPPSGMPNPQDAGPQMTFLSVPAAVYVDDDSCSTMSAETTTILSKSSRDTSSTNLADRRLSTNSWYDKALLVTESCTATNHKST